MQAPASASSVGAGPIHSASPGHAVFAAILIALGVQGLLKGDFTAVWQPVPEGVPAREGLAYLCAFVSTATGVGLLWRRAAATASAVLLAYLVLWILLWRVPVIFRAPATVLPWDGCAETAAIAAGAWVLFASFAKDWGMRRLGFATGERGLRNARDLYGLALIPFGMAHFAFAKETGTLVPGWMPWHLGWTYFTGAAFLAAALAVLSGVGARLAAALSAVQMGLFTLLVWVPIVARGSASAFQWSELAISAALTAAAWVVTDSYRSTSWLRKGQ